MFYFTVAVVAILFIIDITLSILNYSNRHQPIPENVSDVYDQEEYRKWLDYTMEVFWLSTVAKIVRTIVLILFLMLGLFPRLALVADNLSGNILIQTLLFLGLYALINAVVSLGFNAYRTFSIEERYGFNKTTVKTYVADRIKVGVLACILGAGLLYPLLYLYDRLGNISMVYSWLLIMTYILVINVLNTRLFIRLFNKLTPCLKVSFTKGPDSLQEVWDTKSGKSAS